MVSVTTWCTFSYTDTTSTLFHNREARIRPQLNHKRGHGAQLWPPTPTTRPPATAMHLHLFSEYEECYLQGPTTSAKT